MNGERRIRVLVVDDEPDMLEMLEFVLSTRFEVSRATSGQEALSRSDLQTVDLVITDFKMPGMDGLETLIALKQRQPRMEVIVVTGYASPEQERACHAHGAFAFVTKPFDLMSLRALLEKAAEYRDSTHEAQS